jgi:uncharacterized protein
MMTKIEIMQKLREHSPLLRQYHVSRIGIFGSFVNGMQNEKSDIDLLVDFSDTITLFDYVHLADSITSLMHKNVDLVEVDGIKPMIKDRILREVEWIEGL